METNESFNVQDMHVYSDASSGLYNLKIIIVLIRTWTTLIYIKCEVFFFF